MVVICEVKVRDVGVIKIVYYGLLCWLLLILFEILW